MKSATANPLDNTASQTVFFLFIKSVTSYNNKCSLTAGEADSSRRRPPNQLRQRRDHIQAGHPILEALPKRDALFAAGLLETGEGVPASSPVLAAGAGADVP